jgi:hypothetical protein
MTWGLFKKVIEERGVTDDTEIFYIDVAIESDLPISVFVENNIAEITNYPNM